MIMYVKRYVALFLSVALSTAALGAVATLTNNNEIEQIFKYARRAKIEYYLTHPFFLAGRFKYINKNIFKY